MDIPLTSFIDFTLKAGAPKLTEAKNIRKNLDLPYDPKADYYKRFRDKVQEMHQLGLSKDALLGLIGTLPASKESNYSAMVAGYQQFLGRKQTTWFVPPRGIWKHGNIEIALNPEVGLRWEDKDYVLKLYLKADKPSKDRVGSILALMENKLASPERNLGILDVRNHVLYLFEPKMRELMALVEGEAASLEDILSKKRS